MTAAASVGIEELVADPGWFPHRLDWERGRVTFVPTSRERLRSMSFIDGREDFSTGPGADVALSDLLDAVPAMPTGPHFIFHISFCGSTLLASLLDQPGHTLALSEPNVLVNLADWKALRGTCDQAQTDFPVALRGLLRLLDRPWQADEQVLIKPSNWVNNLVPDLLAAPGARAVFIGMDARAFILALFRGGRERLAYNARAISHIVMGDPANEQRVRTALASSREPLEIMARLGALAQRVQMDYFRKAGAGAAFPLLDFADITSAPAEAVARATEALDLSVPAITGDKLSVNAKQRDRPFSAEDRNRADAQIERHYGALADAAIDWVARL